VKTNGKDNAEAIAAAEQLWKQYNPEYPFDFQFLDASFDAMYKTEQRTGKLFTVFSIIAIFVSCLGLFGLATFTAEQRIKEIGIRKVMGASVNEIVALLSKDFLKLIVVSLFIAVPCSYFGMQNWLHDFAYHIPIDWTVFAWAGGISLAIAFLTISFQTVKAAMGNPVESLRTE
jgi:putative ABC transport system permease protein